MAKYETMLITTATLDDEATAALVGKFKSLIEANGTIDSIDEWGKRRLASLSGVQVISTRESPNCRQKGKTSRSIRAA